MKKVYLSDKSAMEKSQEIVANQLFEEGIISDRQVADITAYRRLGIFSLHNELLFLMYLSVLLFTGGAGVIIYKNIDTIGHTVLLGILLTITVACYYFCIRNSKGFTQIESHFDHPVFDYLVLLATILSASFIAYIQFQYNVFGDQYWIPAFITAIVGFAGAYYFDNKSALSIGITALAAAIGITATPKALLENHFFDNPDIFYVGIGLAAMLVLWAGYSEKAHLKKHFTLIYLMFAIHLTGICCIAGMIGDFWILYGIILLGSCFYFYRKSYRANSISLFVFAFLYGYIGFNIMLFRLMMLIENTILGEVLILFSLPYTIGSVLLLIYSIRHFKKRSHDSI